MSERPGVYRVKMSSEPERVCQVCGQPYTAARSDSKYCSHRCCSIAWRDAHYQYKILTCPVCGVEFRSRNSDHKYCSGACRLSSEAKRKHDRYAVTSNGKGKGWSRGMTFVAHPNNATCAYCGKSFFKRPCYQKRGSKLDFCSEDCRVSYMATHPSRFPQTGGKRGSKIGKREDLGGLFVRSAWEANYARYLNWLVSLGEIAKWEYEVDTFEFPVKRGSKFYTPDFKVFSNDGSIEYHEVKGYMDQSSATKIKRMTKYYPQLKLVLIDAPVYRAIARDVCNIIPNWEFTR